MTKYTQKSLRKKSWLQRLGDADSVNQKRLDSVAGMGGSSVVSRRYTRAINDASVWKWLPIVSAATGWIGVIIIVQIDPSDELFMSMSGLILMLSLPILFIASIGLRYAQKWWKLFAVAALLLSACLCMYAAAAVFLSGQ